MKVLFTKARLEGWALAQPASADRADPLLGMSLPTMRGRSEILRESLATASRLWAGRLGPRTISLHCEMVTRV
jgi:hypothetical protein